MEQEQEFQRVVPEEPQIPTEYTTGGITGPTSPREPQGPPPPMPQGYAPTAAPVTGPQITRRYLPIPENSMPGNYIELRDQAFQEFKDRFLGRFIQNQRSYNYGVFYVTNNWDEQVPDDLSTLSYDKLEFVFFCENPDLIPLEERTNNRVCVFPLTVEYGTIELFMEKKGMITTNPGLRFCRRPVMPGLSIGAEGFADSGSICCFLKDQRGERYILTVQHLAEGVVDGANVYQPSQSDASDVSLQYYFGPPTAASSTPIGTTSANLRYVHFTDLEYFDFALLPMNDVSCSNDLQFPTGRYRHTRISHYVERILDEKRQVVVSGRTTAAKTGFAMNHLQEGLIGKINIPFSQGMCVRCPCQPGDSGGLVSYVQNDDEADAMGMVWGGSLQHDFAYFVPMERIFVEAKKHFELELGLLG